MFDRFIQCSLQALFCHMWIISLFLSPHPFAPHSTRGHLAPSHFLRKGSTFWLFVRSFSQESPGKKLFLDQSPGKFRIVFCFGPPPPPHQEPYEDVKKKKLCQFSIYGVGESLYMTNLSDKQASKKTKRKRKR